MPRRERRARAHRSPRALRSLRVRDERGAATAEFAVALPALVLVLAACIGAVHASAETVRLQDAAADAARLAARGDEPGRAVALAGEPAPELTLHRPGDLVCVTLQRTVRVAGLLPLELRGAGCALDGGL